MNHPSRRKRIIRLWIGIVLLSISALFWLMLVIAIVAEPEGGREIILSGLVLSSILAGTGIYCLRHSKRRRKRMPL